MTNILQKIVLALLLFPSTVFGQANTWPDFRGNMIGVPSNYIDSAGNSRGNINMGPYDIFFTPATGAQCIYDELGMTCGTRTDDANSNNRMVNPSDVSPFAAAGKVPGKMIIRGGLDSKTITCAVATCNPADTVTVCRLINGTSTCTVLTYGTEFCGGAGCATDNAMALSLANAINVLTGVGATSLLAVVGVTADRFTGPINIIDSNAHAACTVISLGTSNDTEVEGRLVLRSYTAAGATTSNCLNSEATANTVTIQDGACTTTANLNAAAVATIGAQLNVTGMSLENTNKYIYAWTGAAYGVTLIQNAVGEWNIGDATTNNRRGTIKELRVATVASVDMSSVARQTLYTVPAGLTFYPHWVSVGPCSAIIDAAVGGFGSDTPAQDFFTASSMAHTAAASIAYFYPVAGTAVPSIAAAGTFAYDGTVAEGAADTCTMSVYGELR